MVCEKKILIIGAITTPVEKAQMYKDGKVRILFGEGVSGHAALWIGSEKGGIGGYHYIAYGKRLLWGSNMKNIASHIVSVSFILTLCSCISFNKKNTAEIRNPETDTLFSQVVLKLKCDTASFETYKLLLTQYIKQNKHNDPSAVYYDSVYSLYNKGVPFVRLINADKLYKTFTNNTFARKSASWDAYITIISNYNNFNTDEDIGGERAQEFNFQQYLEKGLILPDDSR